jgi:hypothetical protein
MKLVLPIEGRAATMTRSEGCRPDIIVEVREACRHAGDQLLAGVQLLDRIEAALGEVAQRDEPVPHLVVGDGKNGVLGLVEDDVGVLLAFVGRRQDLVRREDQVREGRLSLMMRA